MQAMILKIAVIGLGRFGLHLAVELTRSGAEVIAIDRNMAIVESVRDQVTLAVRLDSTQEEALRHHGVDQVDAAVVGIGSDFESAVLTTALIKSFKIPRIICRAESATRGRILTQVGADVVVNPEAESAQRWSHRLLLPDLRDYVELGVNHSIIQIKAPRAFEHKTPGELQLRRKYRVTLVALKRSPAGAPEAEAEAEAERASRRKTSEADFGEIIIPEHDTEFLPGDILVLVGTHEDLSQLPKP